MRARRDAVQGSERRARTSFYELPSRRVQMIFLVKGMGRNGMVSCEAFKREGEYQFSMLTLDLKADKARGKKAEHLFLDGSEDVVLFKELSEILDGTHTSGRKESEIGDDEESELDVPAPSV